MQVIHGKGFWQIVNKYDGDRYSKKLTCSQELTVLLYAMIKDMTSFRDIQTGLKTHMEKWPHLGIQTVARSTLSDALARRPYQMFEELFFRFLEKCHRHTAGHSFRVKVPVFTQDATLVSLCLSSFKWAKYRRRKGALKLHTLLDHEGCLPSFIRMTNGKVHEIRVVKDAQYDFPALPPDSILTIDRGYMDYAWLNSLDLQGITFIIPSKCNMAYQVVGQHKEPNKKRGILEDQLIEFVNYYEQKAYPQRIRHIRYRYIDTKGKEQEIEVLTNNMDLAASTISALYKGRWEIETFFRWIKQNLKIKSFYGTSENAVMTQVWVAMILYLLLSFIKFQTRYGYSMLELLRVIRERVLGFESLLELLRVNWERLKLNQSYGVQTAFY
jgi:Transposase DDE domain/Domain of unknown function (DUF4372)